MNIKCISTQEMIVDPFTKPIPKESFYRHVKSRGQISEDLTQNRSEWRKRIHIADPKFLG